MDNWDVIIIGAGSAGLSAGIYSVRSGLRTLILEEKLPGGTIADASTVVNYPGFAEISGGELAEKMTSQCRKAGAIIHDLEPATELDLASERKIVKTSRATYEAKAIVYSTGSHYREIGVKGEKEFKGRGVSYCGVCDGPFFKDKRVLVVGGGNTACITTLYLSGLASQVIVIHRRHAFRAEESLVSDISAKNNITVMWNTEVQEIKGDKQVKAVTLLDNLTGKTSELLIDAVFVQIGEAPNSQHAKTAGVETDEHGYIKVDTHQQTNLPGVFAAGDVTNQAIKQVGTAVGQGITAALEAYSFIRQPYYRK
ncbi:MAG TPA: thioredoxin-disulfide reductase [Candidatus Limnocylindrales bacterium]|nr:thioredoxin-disulfide reductase [Candidatus Limnocylindrales bacterium]